MDPIHFTPVLIPEQFKMVESLAFPIWREHYTPLIGDAQVEYMLQEFQTAQAVEEQVKQGAIYYLMENREGEKGGFLSVMPKPTELFLSKLYLRKEQRGKGYARQALDFIQGMARNRGLGRITLTVHRQNPSVKVYQALGFRILGPVVTDIGGGFVMDDYRMGMELGPNP